MLFFLFEIKATFSKNNIFISLSFWGLELVFIFMIWQRALSLLVFNLRNLKCFFFLFFFNKMMVRIFIFGLGLFVYLASVLRGIFFFSFQI